MYDWRPADVPRTSHCLVPEISRNWAPYSSCGHPDLELLNICFFAIKNSNRCVKEGLFRLKNTFFSLNHQFLCCFPKSFLKVPWRSQMLRPLEDLQGTSSGRHSPAGQLFSLKIIYNNLIIIYNSLLLFVIVYNIFQR